MMVQKEMLKGLSSIIHLNQLCEGCLVGKQFRKTFPKESLYQEQVNPYKKYISMFMVLSNHVRLVKICISYFLLMIIIEEHGYIS